MDRVLFLNGQADIPVGKADLDLLKEQFIKRVKAGVCVFVFRTKKGDRIRRAVGTVNPQFIPVIDNVKAEKLTSILSARAADLGTVSLFASINDPQDLEDGDEWVREVGKALGEAALDVNSSKLSINKAFDTLDTSNGILTYYDLEKQAPRNVILDNLLQVF